MKHAVLMCCYDKPPEELLAVTRRVKEALHDALLVCVFDGCHKKYDRSFIDIALDVDTEQAHPECAVVLNGYNDPCWAYQQGLDTIRKLGTVERLVLIGADVLVPTKLGKVLPTVDPNWAWHAKVIDSESGDVWCSSEKHNPLGWCCSLPLDAVPDLDLEYLNGMAYTDTDWMARCYLNCAGVVLDDRVTAIHLGHTRFAFEGAALPLYLKSRAYTLQKWGGRIPMKEGIDALEYTENRLTPQVTTITYRRKS